MNIYIYIFIYIVCNTEMNVVFYKICNYLKQFNYVNCI